MTKLFSDVDPFEDLEGDEDETDVNLEIPEDNPLSAFVGEGKKYKSEVDLAKAVLEKDRFIARLKGENAELRVDVKTKARVEETVDQLLRARNIQTPAVNADGQPSVNNSGTPDNNSMQNQNAPGLTIDQVRELLEEDRKKTGAQQNIANARKQLVELFGTPEAAQQAVKKVAKDIGESQEFIDSLAARNPAVLLQLVKKAAAEDQSKEASLFPSVNTAGFNKSTPSSLNGTKTKAHYDAIKKNNPSQYWSAAIQGQMHKDAMKLGAAFFN